MAINSVSSSTAANIASVRSQPQSVQVKLQEPPKQEERPALVKQSAKPPAASKEPVEEPKPRPVVNTQGETTGRVISTSA